MSIARGVDRSREYIRWYISFLLEVYIPMPSSFAGWPTSHLAVGIRLDVASGPLRVWFEFGRSSGKAVITRWRWLVKVRIGWQNRWEMSRPRESHARAASSQYRCRHTCPVSIPPYSPSCKLSEHWKSQHSSWLVKPVKQSYSSSQSFVYLGFYIK